ncbi:MAG: lysophospholipid acyltransferase family protein [Planctomycetales bacterium]|nr:lysophospholipid acyltransferase family protein [Planctomycetales bacterium]
MPNKKRSIVNKFGGLCAATGVRAWMGSLSYQAVIYDRSTDPVLPEFRGPVIGVFWHEYLLLPFYLRGRSNTAILTSRHRDADWLSEAAGHLGFEIIRGSTARGGGQALLELIRSGDKNVGIACDGPRGPRRKMAPGPIFLSSKLQVPLITYAVGYDRPKRLRSWDQFAIPRPFSRARWIIGPRMQIPANLDRDGVEHYRVQVEDVLNQLTDAAESWAESDTRLPQQVSVERAPMPLFNRRRASGRESAPELPGRRAAA